MITINKQQFYEEPVTFLDESIITTQMFNHSQKPLIVYDILLSIFNPYLTSKNLLQTKLSGVIK